MIRLLTFIILFFLPLASAYPADLHEIKSPDDNLIFTLSANSKLVHFSLKFKGKVVLDDSPLQLQFSNGLLFNDRTVIGKPLFKNVDEYYTLQLGKASRIRNHYNELTLSFKNDVNKPGVSLIVRVYNDGIAFRYVFTHSDKGYSDHLLEENTQFSFTKNPSIRALFLPNYTTSHEGKYSHVPIEAVPADTLVALPALIQSNNLFIGITEAALLDYAGMYLKNINGRLVSQLSPYPDQPKLKVKIKAPHKSPWRVVMISDRMGALIESNLLTNLNEAPKEDFSWLKPGKTTFPWWNGSVVPDTTFPPGNNFYTEKYYIDFCAENKIDFHSVVEYGGHEWYVNDGANYQPGPLADVTKPIPGLDMQQVCDYAKSKGVGIRIWVHWKALYPKIDEAFTLFEKWGIKGMMIDFMDRDDQQMVNIQNEMLQKAAKHQLHVQFHGAYKPTGVHRTYPNELTREGTLNYEVNKWDTTMTPDHDINIPFTRMLAGSTDYHLGGFRAVPKQDFKVQYIKPLMMGTRCHQLAMYVVLENYLGMICDYPDAYINQPGFGFLQAVPTVWDETKVLAAIPGQYICIARRKKDDWFIGAITNSEGRNVQLDLSFLKHKKYTAQLYTDHANHLTNPNLLNLETKILSSKDVLNIDVAPGGGFAIILKN